MQRLGIYLHEGNECVGPFNDYEEAERFLLLMELFGGSRDGIEITRLDIDVPRDIGKGSILRHTPRLSKAVSPRRR